MPVEVGVLLILILLIRILRRWRRWGPVKVSHVSQEKWSLGDYSGEIYYNRLDPTFLNSKINAEILKNSELHTNSEPTSPNSDLTKESPRILYISPLSFNKKKNHPIPTSLAIMGFDVVCLAPSEFYRIISLESSPQAYFEKLITNYSVQSVICFDHAWSSCVKFLLKKRDKFPPLKYIVLRPTGSWADVKPLTQLILHPLQFLSKIHLSKFVPKKQENSSLGTPSQVGIFDSVLFIHPKTTWLTEQGQNVMNSWIEQMETQFGQTKIQSYR
ncbi:MAG: hypothetical protein ACTSYI_10965, partial [Promethearchaeota archaeon]